MSEIQAPLLVQSGDYGVQTSQLNYLFVPDNIRDGDSVNQLKKMGRIEGLLEKLKTNPERGIDSRNGDDLNKRVINFGTNRPIVEEAKTLWEYIIENFEDEMLRVLCLAAAVALIVGIINEGWKEGWLDGVAIFIAVILIVSVTAGNNYMKDQQFRKLNAISQNRDINVIRGGQVISLNVYDLLVGDIVKIGTGEILPVDGLLFKANNMSLDESSITGETNLVRKQVPETYEPGEKRHPFLISGSKVMEGTGDIIVCAIGENSQWGQAKKLMKSGKQSKTPLQEKLNELADDIGKIGFRVFNLLYPKMACLTFLAMTAHLVVESYFVGFESLLRFQTLQHLLNFFIVAVTIVVVAVPEGLPLAVTIALAYSVGKMKEENNLVRYLQACETMGGANNICSDKTGTLTKNLMTVTNLFIQEQDITKFDSRLQLQKLTIDMLCEGIALNSNAYPQIDQNGNFIQEGNKTECALLELSYILGQDFRKIREASGARVRKTIPFSSERKRMSVLYDFKNDRTSFRVYTKGAPDVILEKCTHYINKNGVQTMQWLIDSISINQEFRTKINSVIKQYADGSLRTLLLAFRETMFTGKPEKPEQFPPDEEVEQRLVVIGIAGIKDPLRDGIKEAVIKCHKAGVTVRMVTGDNLDTAVAISKDAGILPPDYVYNPDSLAVLEGKTFRQLVEGYTMTKDEKGEDIVRVGNENHFRDIARELRVLARSSPEDKFILVTGLKQIGNVVAVTGDGTNDGPALKSADIGFAMGIAGTEVAKEASGIILLDDNFSSIVTAIKWGRNIFECIRKFLQFQITVNIVAVFMAFMGGVVLRESPLTSIQMLWVNLIMDTLASLALATEPPSEELLDRKPVGRNDAMITPTMWRNIVCQGVWQIAVLSILLFYGDDIFGVPSSIGTHEHFTQATAIHYTIFFHSFVFLQVFNEINARKLKSSEVNVFVGFFNNPLFLIVIFGTIIIQMILVEIGGKAVKVSPLTLNQHAACIGIGLTSLINGYLIKQIPSSFFENFELFSENRGEQVDPNTIEGRTKRPSTLLRKKQNLENYKQNFDKLQASKAPREIELKMANSIRAR